MTDRSLTSDQHKNVGGVSGSDDVGVGFCAGTAGGKYRMQQQLSIESLLLLPLAANYWTATKVLEYSCIC